MISLLTAFRYIARLPSGVRIGGITPGSAGMVIRVPTVVALGTWGLFSVTWGRVHEINSQKEGKRRHTMWGNWNVRNFSSWFLLKDLHFVYVTARHLQNETQLNDSTQHTYDSTQRS